ncbi:MAG: hypothetical protein E4G90_03835 [Gemmatimonadales bacterium]|nr:MAG: hypothetical protein E4G90_03835 [Gemmatimonadales bacterium]
MAALAITPASGSITAAVSVCRIDVDAADQNDLTGFDADLYPSSPEFRYYILADAPAGVDDLKSHVFGVDENGDSAWDNVIFPAAGSWTLRLRDASDDSDVATAAVTVS